MKRLLPVFIAALMVLAFSGMAHAQSGVFIENDDLTLEMGDSEQLEAVYRNDAGEEVDTTIVWAVDPAELGTIDSSFVFTAMAVGEGIITATVGEEADTISVTVEGGGMGDFPRVMILRRELELGVGDSEQLEAVYLTAPHQQVDTTFTWSVDPAELGTIDSSNVFTAEMEGEGTITASVGDLSDTIPVTVEGEGGDHYPAVVIQTEALRLQVGDTADLHAVYYDSTGTEVDTVFTWAIDPDSLGSIDSNFVFTAETEGLGTLTASLGDLSDSVPVMIGMGGGGGDEPGNDLYLVPGDTVVTVGTTLNYTMWQMLEDADPQQLEATFSMRGGEIGTLTEGGQLDISAAGFGLIMGSAAEGNATALVVADPGEDDGDINTITITRDSRGPHGPITMATVHEGEAWTIGGLPHPMNVLNGGTIYFPHGSLHEDIELHVSLPGWANTDGDSVNFGHRVVSGVDFQVIVDSSAVEPYWFDSPLFVSLVFKRGLVRQMGIDPEDLALYFAMDDGDSLTFDSTGIANTVVDSVRNRIFSNVAHFSSLVVAPSTNSTSVGEGSNAAQPKSFELAQPYPNPFNPTTTVQVTLPARGELRVAVYDVTGRLVTQLAKGSYASGTHRWVFDASDLASGVYFIRAETPGSPIATRKVVLLK